MYVRMHLKMSYSVDIDKLSPYSSLGGFYPVFPLDPFLLKIFPISVTLSEIFRIFAVVNNINFTVADGMASQRSAPQRGNEHLAQGSALGDRHKER